MGNVRAPTQRMHPSGWPRGTEAFTSLHPGVLTQRGSRGTLQSRGADRGPEGRPAAYFAGRCARSTARSQAWWPRRCSFQTVTEETVSLKEAAEEAGVKPETLRRWAKSGVIPGANGA